MGRRNVKIYRRQAYNAKLMGGRCEVTAIPCSTLCTPSMGMN
ncbi:hypothetical protein [Thiopseudomonas alkaliphila]|nr:hypothetical protein [Thiopseudomonas alkaliphila]